MREGLKEWTRAFMEIVERNEPRIIAFTVFFNEDETEMTSIQVHPDSSSMEYHTELLDQMMTEVSNKYGNWFDFIELPAQTEYYGSPSKRALEEDRAYAEQGLLSLKLKPMHVAGFIRSASN